MELEQHSCWCLQLDDETQALAEAVPQQASSSAQVDDGGWGLRKQQHWNLVFNRSQNLLNQKKNYLAQVGQLAISDSKGGAASGRDCSGGIRGTT